MKEGILLVDKPAGMSSFGVVARVRRVLTQLRRKEALEKGETPPKKVKVGHTGTLDPFATGLLILLTGKETRKAGEFLKLDKEYIATLRLGEISRTGDPEGELTEIIGKEGEYMVEFGGHQAGDVAKIPNKEAVEKSVEKFVGENWQKVPAFSAVKIKGQRAYKLAREGREVEMPTRKVRIYELEILRYEWPELEVRCKVSSGTYIRTLGEDIGAALGVGAYLTALRRTQIGEYRIEDARTLEEVMEGNLLEK